MIDLLRAFSTLTLISSAVLILLPEGSLRKTASLVLGLMITLCWAQGLMDMLDLPDFSPDSTSALASTSLSLADAEAEALAAMRAAAEVTSPR